MSRYARRLPAAIIAAAFIFSSFVSAAGNPACPHHSGGDGHSAGHDSATIHAGHAGPGDPGSENPSGHGSEPCNCLTLCQNPATLASLEPAGSLADVPDLFRVAVATANTPDPRLETPDFLHPFPNPPPIV